MKFTKHIALSLIVGMAVFAPSYSSIEIKAEEEFGSLYIAKQDTSEILNVAEQMPQIKGGIKALYDNVVYPLNARKMKVEGRVFIRFVVNKDGSVESPEVLKDIGYGCGEAAIKSLSKVEFTPAMNGGQPVRVYYTLPIAFKMKH